MAAICDLLEKEYILNTYNNFMLLNYNIWKH